MIRTETTRVRKNSEMVSKYLNNIYNTNTGFNDVEIEVLNELLEEILSWRTCLDEIELKVKSLHHFNDDIKYIEYDNKEITIY